VGGIVALFTSATTGAAAATGSTERHVEHKDNIIIVVSVLHVIALRYIYYTMVI